MFLIRFADFHHGGQALQIAGISPWILTVSEIGQRAFFHDLFHEGILGDLMLLEKKEEVRGKREALNPKYEIRNGRSQRSVVIWEEMI
jgi:hypothetical protein